MSKGIKSSVVVAGLLVIALLPLRAALAVEVVIDDFSFATAAPGTLWTDTLGSENVLSGMTANSTVTAEDTGASGVIGGTRQLDVSVGVCPFCPFDNALVGVVAASQVLDYSSTPQTDGSFTLIYDADGVGLNASLASAEGIRLPFINVDVASYPLDVVITLISGANSATLNLVDNSAAFNVTLEFPFADFSNIDNVDLTSLTRIEIMVDPAESDTAADLQLGPITTYGTVFEPDCSDGIDNDDNGLIDCNDPACLAECPPAPVMSGGMTTALIAVLATCGLWSIARTRPRDALRSASTD